jgi:hypothetical protein
MNTENGLLIVLLLIGIIVVANGMMFLAVRRSVRGDKTTHSLISGAQDALGKPFQKEKKSLEELRKRVEELEEKK